MNHLMRSVIGVAAVALLVFAAWAEAHAAPAAACVEPDTTITVPPGFCATVFADIGGHPRHLVVSDDGVVYVNTWSGRYYANSPSPGGGFLIALRDTHGSGRADLILRFGNDETNGATGGTGIAIHGGALFAEDRDRILRYPLRTGTVGPVGPATVVVDGLPLTGDHPMHPFAIAADGSLYVDLGSATNACQAANRMPASPGHDPCTELETRGGIWRYDANRIGQHFSPRERYAIGIRNADGIAIDATGRRVFATQHGRDQLSENWPRLYQPIQGAILPAEELVEVEQGVDYGWPECYYDPGRRRLVLAPEYGGDGGDTVGTCASKRQPIAAYPAHWAPNDLTFYDGTQFPDRYRGGAFIAFHGSWNRAPFPQEGYNIVFQPFAGGQPSGAYEIFARGFAGPMKTPARAAHRPSGVAVGGDGALYVSDDAHGRIWRITYTGLPNSNRAEPASASPASRSAVTAADRAEPPEGTHADAGANPGGLNRSISQSLTGAERFARITPAMVALGARVYHGEVGGGTCAGCHGDDATGSALAPDLTTGRWLWGDGSYAAILATIAAGVAYPKEHTGVMPPLGGAPLSADELAAVAAYVYSLKR